MIIPELEKALLKLSEHTQMAIRREAEAFSANAQEGLALSISVNPGAYEKPPFAYLEEIIEVSLSVFGKKNIDKACFSRPTFLDKAGLGFIINKGKGYRLRAHRLHLEEWRMGKHFPYGFDAETDMKAREMKVEAAQKLKKRALAV